MQELQITMLGPSGVGKTTLLLALYEWFKKDITGEVGFALTPDEETEAILQTYLEKLTTLADEMRADERDKGVAGTRATAGPDSLPKYIFDLFSQKNKQLRLIFRDYPGGYLTSKDNAEVEFVKKLIKDSHVVIVTIDTPAMIEPKKEDFADRRNWDSRTDSGRWHQARNQPDKVLEFFQSALAGELTEPKLIMFAPVKCETYVQTPESCKKLLEFIKDKYGPLLQLLSRYNNMAVVSAPVQTVGCLHFWKIDIENENKPRFWFRKTSSDAVYAPKNGDQLLRYLLCFLFTICNRQELAVRSPILRSFRNIIGHETVFEKAIKEFARRRKQDEGFAVLQGEELFFIRGRR